MMMPQMLVIGEKIERIHIVVHPSLIVIEHGESVQEPFF